MIFTTTPTIEGRRIVDYKGVVFGEVIAGVNFLNDIAAEIRNLVGGRSAAYEDELIKARSSALGELCERAEQLEADAVLHLDDGKYALIEFKLGSKEIEDGASHLLQIKQLIKKHNENEDQVPLREPDLLLVITGGEMAYTRNDGVKIVPIGTLKN